jgi:hypothetical protein
LEDDDPPPRLHFVSILGLPGWRERLSLPEHSCLGSVDILPLPVTLSHAKGDAIGTWALRFRLSEGCPLPPARTDSSTTAGSRKATSSNSATLGADTSLCMCGITSGAA